MKSERWTGLPFVDDPDGFWDNGQVGVSKASVTHRPTFCIQKIIYSFYNGDDSQIKKVETTIQQWKDCVNLEFERVDWDAPSHIRISFAEKQNSSLVGKQELKTDGSVTMYLGDVTSTPGDPTLVEQSVILHEWGHALGLQHEHQVCCDVYPSFVFDFHLSSSVSRIQGKTSYGMSTESLSTTPDISQELQKRSGVRSKRTYWILLLIQTTANLILSRS